MWRLAAILCFVFSVIHDVESGTRKFPNQGDASVPLLERMEGLSTSDAPNRDTQLKKKSEPLPVIILEFRHFLYLDANRHPWVGELPPGVKQRVITNKTGTELVGVFVGGHACPFVISGVEKNIKVSLKIINNIAKEPINVDPEYDPLLEFKKKRLNRSEYIRTAEIPPSGSPIASASRSSLRFPGSPIS